MIEAENSDVRSDGAARNSGMTRNLISVEDARALIAEEGALVFESGILLPPPRFDGDYNPISGESTWLQGHIPGSRHIDLLTRWVDVGERGYHFAAPNSAVLAEQLGQDGIDGTKPVLVYDADGGIWASRLWWTLRNAGISAAVIDGGLDAWTGAGFPIEHGPAEQVAPVQPPAAVDNELWVRVEEVQQISRGEAPGQLVCALSRPQFEGTEPTRYGRRGHIPRSINVVAREFVGEDGKMVDAAGREGNLGVLPEVASRTDPLVLYCGGGISACLAALGLVESGYTNIRIYDGSIEEWAARDDLPLVVGNSK